MSRTNYEKIRDMGIEEMAGLINKIKFCGGLIARKETSQECHGCTDGICCNVKEWLEKEAEDDEIPDGD